RGVVSESDVSLHQSENARAIRGGSQGVRQQRISPKRRLTVYDSPGRASDRGSLLRGGSVTDSTPELSTTVLFTSSSRSTETRSSSARRRDLSAARGSFHTH